MLNTGSVSYVQLPPYEQGAPGRFAVITTPQHEKEAVRHFNFAGVKSFLPAHETPRVWTNRQKINVVLPLFPNHLFVRTDHRDRGKVSRTPGVRQLVDTSREALPLPDDAIEFLRASLNERRAEPYPGIVVGKRVRIKSGAMQGVEGCLVRNNSEWRFVLTVEIIHHHVAIKVDASTVEPIVH